MNEKRDAFANPPAPAPTEIAYARARETKRAAVPPVRLALSPDEAAQAIGVSRDFLDEHVSHELAWVRRGRRKLVSVKELESWLERAATRALE